MRIGRCRKHELGMQGLKRGILATDGTRNEHGMWRGLRWGSAGSYGRSIIRRGEFHESPFLPFRVSSVANNLLMVIRLRIGELAVNRTFFILFRQIAYGGLGTARELW
jgi:hypothetical protein